MHSFIPHSLPIQGLNSSQLLRPVGEANAALSRYDGMLQTIINPDLLLAPLTTNEAVLSSRIEGTQASLSEVYKHEAGEEYTPEKVQDIGEIINYREALLSAEKELHYRPLSLDFLKALHGILMKGVRGKNKSPGEFRKKQNWIGAHGCSIEQARFVPPSELILEEHLEKWQRYGESAVDEALVQMAVIHAQFEILHPFEDGNGRMGRILIPLYLYQRRVLHRPMFYLSEYLEAHRSEYYDRLLAITKEDDWQGWIEFFLAAIAQQAKDNAEKVRNIVQLYETLKTRFREATHSQFAVASLDAFFLHPVMRTPDFKRYARIPTYPTANSILRALLKHALIVLVRKGAGQTPSSYALPELINIAEGKKVFNASPSNAS